jgi:hypothetical protein
MDLQTAMDRGLRAFYDARSQTIRSCPEGLILAARVGCVGVSSRWIGLPDVAVREAGISPAAIESVIEAWAAEGRLGTPVEDLAERIGRLLPTDPILTPTNDGGAR